MNLDDDRDPRPTCLAEGTYSGVPGRTNQDVPAHGSAGTSSAMPQWSRRRVSPLSVGREALTRTTQILLRAGLGGGQSLSRRPQDAPCLVWRRRVNDRCHFDRPCLGVYLHRRKIQLAFNQRGVAIDTMTDRSCEIGSIGYLIGDPTPECLMQHQVEARLRTGLRVIAGQRR